MASGVIRDFGHVVIQDGKAIGSKVEAFSSSYSVRPEDGGKLLTNRGASAAVTFTLPTLSSVPAGWNVSFFAVDVDPLIVSRAASDSIIGGGASAATSFTVPYGFRYTVISDGSNWLQAVPAESVDAFGLTGDGTTDDSSALVSAISAGGDDAIHSFTGGKTYRLNSIAIDGRDRVVFQGNGAVLKMLDSPTNPMFRLGDASANTDIVFDGFIFDGNSFAGTTNGIFARIKQTTRLTFRNCWFHDSWNHALSFASGGSGSSIIDIHNCRFTQIGRGTTADATFSANTPHGVAIAFGTSNVASDIRIQGCYFDQVKGGACIRWDGIDRIVITGNEFRRTGYRGIFSTTTASTGMVIVGNAFYDIGAAYESSGTPGSSLYGQGTNAIFVKPPVADANEILIEGNHIERTGENGLECRGLMKNNIIIDPGWQTGSPYSDFGSGLAREGIYPEDGSVVKGNAIYEPATFGIARFQTGAIQDIVVADNYVRNPVTKGIRFQVDGAGNTMARVYVHGNQVERTSGSPTHGIHMQLSNTATIAATTVVKGNITSGTWSTAAITVDGTGTSAENTSV